MQYFMKYLPLMRAFFNENYDEILPARYYTWNLVPEKGFRLDNLVM